MRIRITRILVLHQLSVIFQLKGPCEGVDGSSARCLLQICAVSGGYFLDGVYLLFAVVILFASFTIFLYWTRN